MDIPGDQPFENGVKILVVGPKNFISLLQSYLLLRNEIEA